MYLDRPHKICATIEARMSSTRLPGKVLLPIAGKSMLSHIVERIRRSQYIDEIVIATTIDAPDSAIVDLAEKLDCKVYRGSVDNIVIRLLGASEMINADVIVQTTGDNPLIDSAIIDRTLELYFTKDCDYACNNLVDTFPRGLDVRVFSKTTLQKVKDLTHDPIDLLHGSYYIYRNPQIFRLVDWQATKDCFWPELRLTVDEPEDYKLVQEIYDQLYYRKENFTTVDVIRLLKDRKDLISLNTDVRQKLACEG